MPNSPVNLADYGPPPSAPVHPVNLADYGPPPAAQTSSPVNLADYGPPPSAPAPTAPTVSPDDAWLKANIAQNQSGNADIQTGKESDATNNAYMESAKEGFSLSAKDLLQTVGKTGEMAQHALDIAPNPEGIPETLNSDAKWWGDQADAYDQKMNQAGTSAMTRIPGEVIGGFPLGSAEWSAGVLFATLHGAVNNPDHPIRSAVVGGAARAAQSGLMVMPMGRLLTGIGFLGVTAFQDMANGRTSTVPELAISGIIGALNGHRLSDTDKAALQAAKNGLAESDTTTALAAISGLSREAKVAIRKAAMRGANAMYMAPEVRATLVDHPDVVNGADDEEQNSFVDTPFTRKGREKVARSMIITRMAQAHQHSQIALKLQGFADYMGTMEPEEQAALTKEYIDNGSVPSNPEASDWFKVHTEMMDRQSEYEHKIAGMEYELRENYVPSMVKSGPDGEDFGGIGRAGKPGFTRQKVFADPVELMAAGYTPITTNPGVMDMLRITFGSLAGARISAVGDMEKAGMATTTEDLHGWVPVVVGGKRYMMEPSAKLMLDRLLPQNLNIAGLMTGNEEWLYKGGMAAYRAFMKMKAVSSTTVLSLSAFHAVHEIDIDLKNRLALTVDAMAHRKEGPAGGFNPSVNAKEGWNAISEWEKPYDQQSAMGRTATDFAIAGGYVPSRGEIYNPGRTALTLESALEENASNFNLVGESWPRMLNFVPQAGQKIGLFGMKQASNLVNLIQHGASSIQDPLFKEMIPSLKYSAYLTRAVHELKMDPTLMNDNPLDSLRLKQKMMQVGDEIDFRYGELQYNRLAWNRIVKRALFSTMLSVGWNYGFLHQFVGGAMDLGKATVGNTVKLALRKPADYPLTSRAIYSTSYLMLGAVSIGMLSYLNTGKMPSVKGTFYIATPPTPESPNGNYLSTPLFNREPAGVYYHVKNQGPISGMGELVMDKMAPIIPTMEEIMENKNYFGEQIYDPEAPAATMWMQIMLHAGEGFMPISLSPLQTADPSAERIAVSSIGLNPAAGYVSKPEIAQTIMNEYDATHKDITPYSEVKAREAFSNLWQLNAAGKAGSPEFDHNMRVYLRAHPADTVEKVFANLNKPQGASEFAQLTPDQQIHIFKTYGREAIGLFPFVLKIARPEVVQILEEDNEHQ